MPGSASRYVFALLVALSTSRELSAQVERKSGPGGTQITVLQQAPMRLVVAPFEGPGSAIPRGGVIRALEEQDTVDLLPARVLKKHADALDGTPAGYAEVARRLGAVAILRGRSAQDRKGYRLTLTVIQGQTGEIVARLHFTGARLVDVRRKVQRELWSVLAPLLEPKTPEAAEDAKAPPVRSAPSGRKETTTATPPTSPAPRPATPPTSPAPERPDTVTRAGDAEADRRRGASCEWLAVSLGGGLAQREFNYERESRGALRAYTLQRSPVLALDATWFPFAPSCTWAASLGVRVGYSQIVGASSVLADRTLDTSAAAASADLLWRFRVAPVTITPSLGYRARRFTVEGDVVPDVGYQGVRAGVDVTASLGRLDVGLAGGLTALLSTGELGSKDWFPEADGIAYQLGAHAGLAVLDLVSVIARAELEMYRLSLNVSDLDSPGGVADGAYDRHLSLILGARLNLPARAR